MQIGVIGLGRMGANIVRRLERGRHECVAYDADASVVARLAAGGLPALPSLAAFVERLKPPRMVWVMVPAGAPTQRALCALPLAPGPHLRGARALGHALQVRRPRGAESRSVR